MEIKLTINETLNYLLAKRTELVVLFSAQVTTGSTYLKGGGGEAGDGWAMPRSGKLVAVDVWDGTMRHSDTDEIAFAAGDRISVYASYGGTNFAVTVRINGVDTALSATNVLPNTTLFATLNLIME